MYYIFSKRYDLIYVKKNDEIKLDFYDGERKAKIIEWGFYGKKERFWKFFKKIRRNS